MVHAKLNENQFKAVVNSFDTIDEQIRILQQAKKNTIESFGISVQAFYSRRKNLGL